jgi:Helicase conserved C-terminal domain/SNF2-related domain
MAALDGWNGALLLEPVGTGKTWIALGVAALERGLVVAIVPAILQSQWSEAARRANVPLHLWTHERASRGALPAINPSLVIVDEAHRLRDPAAKRTQTIAPWLVGRRTLLLTATPIVNRLADLVTLLRIGVPEDALALDGIVRLGDLEVLDQPPACLRRIAIRTGAHSMQFDRRNTTLLPDDDDIRRGEDAVHAIGELVLSDNVSIRRLLTSVLLDAAASSDAAFRQSLKRYRALLLQARDAGGASRAMLRRFAGESLDQLVFWSLLDTDAAAGELPVDDIERVERLLTRTPNDLAWIDRLAAHCSDTRPTVCFTRHRATAGVLRTSFGDNAAWITGVEAGIGPHRVPREQLLAAFGPNRATWSLRRHLPQLLIATDVASEGLDLHSAGRIVHVDLPWTATRVEQREGRLLRLGQEHADVEVLLRLPPPAIEAALAPQARVRRKRRLADVWLQTLELNDPDLIVPSGGPFVSHDRDGRPGTGEFAIALERAHRSGLTTITMDCDGDIVAVAAAALRMAIARSSAAEDGSRALVSRVHRLARQAASRRDGPTLQRLDRLLRFACASPTLGARLEIAVLTAGNDTDLVHANVPDVPAPSPVRATLVGAILYRSP